VVLAVLVAIAAVVVRWMYSPRALGDFGNAARIPLSVNRTIYVGQMAESRSGKSASFDLRSVTARVDTNTAHADVQVLMCTIATGPIGAVDVTEPYCASAVPVHPGRVKIGSATGAVDVVLAVTPHAVGVVHVSGLDIRYRLGLRRGHQHTGLDVQVDATAH
jgi:hypothetical protein